MGRQPGRRAFKKRRHNHCIFQRGNIPWNKGLVADGGGEEGPGSAAAEARDVAGSSGRTADEEHRQETPPEDSAPRALINPKVRLSDDHYKMLYRSGDKVIIPRLRNIHRTNYSEPKRSYSRDSVKGNRVIDMERVQELFNLFSEGHRKANGRKICRGRCRFSQKMEGKVGFGCTEVIVCTLCRYRTTPMELFRRVEKRRQGTRGPLPVKLNVQAVTAGAKDRYGPTALLPLFGSMDVFYPSRSTLQKHQNNACDVFETLSEEQMRDNCQTLAEVKKLRQEAGLKESCTISGESDVGYNNPPKGKSRSQPGTQAECPFFENETEKKMILGLSVVSQHCAQCEERRRQGLPTGPGSHDNCTQNFEKHIKIGNSESKLAKSNAEAIMQCSGMAVGTLCTDNDGKILKGTNEAMNDAGEPSAEKQDCLQHNKRNHRARVYGIELEVFEGGNNTKQQVKELSRKVGYYLVDRCGSVLYETKKLHPDNKTTIKIKIK